MGLKVASATGTDAGAYREGSRDRGRRRSRGQVLVIFALSAFVFVGMCAVVVDVAWYWANTLRVQRAADAAALAGAVLLPGKVDTGSDNAYLRATNEAKKNGYVTTAGGATVTPIQDSLAVDGGNPRQLDVTITAPVPTFFMRVFGINSINATRSAKAEYVLPVPMGSPQNYYGVGLFIAALDQTGFKSGSPAGAGWTTPQNADGNNNNQYASSPTTSGAKQSWGTFGLLSAPNAFPAGDPVDGIEVQLRAKYAGTGSPTSGCQIQVQLSWDGGSNWSPSSPTSATTITLGSSEASFTLGSATSTTDWSGHTWTQADLADGRLTVRLTFNKQSCGSGRYARVDTLQVQATSQAGPRPVYAPDGTLLAPQNFWGAMQSQGAPNIQGDAFMTKYQSRSPSSLNGVDSDQDPDAYFDPLTYYNYGVDIPANATNGEVWLFDPGFCEVSTSQGTGESWTVGGSNGYSSAQPVSAFYELYDKIDPPYSPSDVPVASSGNTFKDLSLDDSTLGGSNGSGSCQGLAWHDGWWRLASGLTGGPDGTTYRLHTHTDGSDQNNTTALNAFAIWATATGGTPSVYGNGAMEAYVRLPGGQASQFYLAQIASVHAGKTMQIDLWDPGDTGALSASLQILQPTSGGYVPASFTYTTSRGTTDSGASSCPASGSGTSVTTNTGGNSLFNGCWLRITIVLDDNYAAPTPPGETQGGWWKIKYTMGGSTSSYSTDLTTWKVQILGNPVHLIVP